MLDLARHQVLWHNIFTEVQGLQSTHMTLHNLIHLLEDIDCFSSPDDCWCFLFERAVKKYIERSSNKKGIEHTFATAEARREFLKFFRGSQAQVQSTTDFHAEEREC